jgi:hypothetical protein
MGAVCGRGAQARPPYLVVRRQAATAPCSHRRKVAQAPVGLEKSAANRHSHATKTACGRGKPRPFGRGRQMKPIMLAAALVALALPLSATIAAAGPIERACLGSDRKAANRATCGCIQQVADTTLRGSDQRRAAKFFTDPDQAQETMNSGRVTKPSARRPRRIARADPADDITGTPATASGVFSRADRGFGGMTD